MRMATSSASITRSRTDEAFAYDPLNRLTNMVDATMPGSTRWTWTSFGAFYWGLDWELVPWANASIHYTYTDRLLTNRRLPLPPTPYAWWIETFAYDSQRRLQSITTQDGAYIKHYQGAGPLARIFHRPSGSSAENWIDRLDFAARR